MHKQYENKRIEDYMGEVARQIGSVPKPRRDEELKEMRAHLVHAVAANWELGMSEDVALANALDDFGTPEEAALNVVKAWRCFIRKQGVKTFWHILSIQSAFYIFLMLFMSPKASDVHLFTCCWAFTFVACVLLILGPHYLASQSDYRRLIATRARR